MSIQNISSEKCFRFTHIISKLHDFDLCVISAEGTFVPPGSNDISKLWATLLKLGYGILKASGRISNEGWTSFESISLIAINLNNDPNFIQNISKLGTAFNQEEIFVREQDVDYTYSLGTGKEKQGYCNPISTKSLQINEPRVLAEIDCFSAHGNMVKAYGIDPAAREVIKSQNLSTDHAIRNRKYEIRTVCKLSRLITQ